MCAVYRIAVQGWTKEAAIREMRQGGYGFHRIWGNLPNWIESLDIESVKKEAGIETGTKQSSAAGRSRPIRGGTNGVPLAGASRS